MATPLKPRRSLRPSRLVLAGAVLAAVVVAASGILGAEVTRSDHSLIARPVFYGIPHALRALFYVTTVALVLAVGWLFAQRVENWERGQPDRRTTTAANRSRRIADLRRGLTMQTLLRDPAAGLMHSLIYFPFLVLFAVTSVLEIDHLIPEPLKFLHGGVYEGYKFVGDTAGVLFVIGITWAAVRRYVQRPYRIRIKTRPEDALILATLGLIGVTGLVVQGLRIAEIGRPSYEEWGFVGYLLADAFSGIGRSTLGTLHEIMWAFHVFCFLAFLAILPTTKLRHMVTSPVNMYLRDRDRPKGP